MNAELGDRDSSLLGARVETRKTQYVRVDSVGGCPCGGASVLSLGNGPPRGRRPVRKAGHPPLTGRLTKSGTT